jgi:hypothetical protein
LDKAIQNHIKLLDIVYFISLLRIDTTKASKLFGVNTKTFRRGDNKDKLKA